MKKILALLALTFVTILAQAESSVHIEVGKNYKDYSNEELRKRVWDLERAVSQMQEQMFQLAMRVNGGIVPPPANHLVWTCRIESFGKTHVAAGSTKASALAQVLKKCSDATNAVHCHETDVTCDNE